MNADLVPRSTTPLADVGLWLRKQPSGGRGEYEVVGHQGQIAARDIDDRVLRLVTPYGEKDTHVYLGKQGGKRRLRLNNPKTDIHVQRQLAAMLLLPKSTRDEARVSTSRPIVLEGRYILDIEINLVSLSADYAVVSPTRVLTRSGDHNNRDVMQSIEAEHRFEQVATAYAYRHVLPPRLNDLLRNHESLARDQVTDFKVLEKIVSSILDELSIVDEVDYLPASDPLPALLKMCGIVDEELDIPIPTAMPPGDLEIRRRSEHIYRLRKSRGSSGRKFRSDVQAAYNFRCAFCGFRAPSVQGRSLSGVDAAHILPWGEFDMDIVPNGLMLCKQHHWAFDSHILTLHHSAGSYFVQLADDTKDILEGDENTMDILNLAVGRISEERLPGRTLRPDSRLIEELYRATT